MSMTTKGAALMLALVAMTAGCNTTNGDASHPTETTVANGTPTQTLERCGGDPLDVQVDWNLSGPVFAYLIAADGVDPSWGISPDTYKLACTKGTVPHAYECTSARYNVSVHDGQASVLTVAEGGTTTAVALLTCDQPVSQSP